MEDNLQPIEVDFVEKFDEVLNGFDFKKVENIMNLLEWKWLTNNGFKTPSIEEMQRLCKRIFEDALENFLENQAIMILNSSGGFEVIISSNRVNLRFIASYCEWDKEVDCFIGS